jgi:outer membrane protein
MGMNMKIALAIGVASLGLLATTASAERGDWIIRAGATMVDPTGSIKVDFGDGAGGTVPATIEADDKVGFGFNFTYMFADNWGFELLAALPFKHDIRVTVPDGSFVPLTVEQIPPTLSIQYHFSPNATIRPYVGVGLNYTEFSNEEFDPEEFDPVEVGSSTGFAAQVGADFGPGENWLINVDIRYIDMEPEIRSLDEDGDVYERIDFPVDPIVYSLMIGYRF